MLLSLRRLCYGVGSSPMSETISGSTPVLSASPQRGRIDGSRALWGYVSIDAVLLVGAAVLPWPASWSALVAMTVFGVVALGVGVYRRRPDVPVAWWLAVTGSVFVAALALTDNVILGHGPIGSPPI